MSGVLETVYKLTESSNYEGNNEPGASPDKLVWMETCGEEKENDENDSCYHGGVIVVVFEFCGAIFHFEV